LGDQISSVTQETHGRDTKIIQIFGWKKVKRRDNLGIRRYVRIIWEK